jgi:hypothetical protein
MRVLLFFTFVCAFGEQIQILQQLKNTVANHIESKRNSFFARMLDEMKQRAMIGIDSVCAGGSRECVFSYGDMNPEDLVKEWNARFDVKAKLNGANQIHWSW